MTANTEESDDREERRSKYHEADVVVVGAGIFGCAIAHALASQGRSVILLERWMKEPDRIVGELLQPGGVRALRELGLGACLDDIDAVPCHGYHVLYGGDEVVIPYPVVDDAGNIRPAPAPAAKPDAHGAVNGAAKRADPLRRPEGRSFHHGRFIMQLRRACQRHPNITVVEAEATATVQGEDGPDVLGVEARTTDPTTGQKRPDCFFASLTIVADGYASKFRRQLLGPAAAPVVRSKFYALELRDCAFPPAGYGHVVIGSAYPVLLYQIGSRETRALIDVPLDLPAAGPAAGGVRGYIRDVVVPALPPHVRPALVAAMADGKIPRSMPNSWLPPTPPKARPTPPGILLMGDAANMRHPLTGGGMTVALRDAVLLSALLAPAAVPDLADRAAVARAAARFHVARRPHSVIINVLAQALYALFAAQGRPLRALQRGCFAYFRAGVTDGPMGLLGGLIRRPAVLAWHFFSVAFLALWLNAVDVVTAAGWAWALFRLPLALADAVLILWTACVVFLPYLWRELR